MITESHPLILVKVDVYVPAADTEVPLGKVYEAPLQIAAFTVEA